MKRFLCCFLVMAMVVGFTGCAPSTPQSSGAETPSQNENLEKTMSSGLSDFSGNDYIIGGGSSGGTYNAVSSVFAQFLSKAEVAKFTAQATTGSGQNITFMQNESMEFGLANSSTCRDAIEGKGLFEGKPYDGIRAICLVYPGVFQQFVTTSSKIETVDDLFGKKLSIGGPGSGDVSAAEEVYATFGMSMDDFDPQYLGSGEGAESMKDAHIDGAIGIAQVPFSAFVEMTSKAINKAKLISLSDEAIEKLTTGESARYFPYTVPANSYGNQTEDVKTVANGQLLITTVDMDEELVYQITKTIFEGVNELSTYHGALATMNAEEAIEVSGITLHPGAERYFKEIGIID
ncbi:MAG: TAXI family TRAP transporter solute-binding subunit [Sedimentibacter sp.]